MTYGQPKTAEIFEKVEIAEQIVQKIISGQPEIA